MSQYKPYTGIGSRNTPADMMLTIAKVGFALGSLGYTLRSGGAQGADTAFEQGASTAQAPKEIF